MYEQMYDDKRRNDFYEQINAFVQSKFLEPATEAHVRATVAITTLLKNAPELGSGQIGKDGVLGMLLGMAQSDDKIQQIAAAEALIAGMHYAPEIFKM